jgi:hypothetical protein
MRVRTLPAVLALALVASACADRSPVAPASTPRFAAGSGNHTITETAVSFSLPVDPNDPGLACGLPARVDGTGTLRTVVKQVETGSGKVRLSISAAGSGTAVGTDGSTYTWTYDQRLRFVDVASLPTAVTVVDQFHLRGRNGGPSYKVLFHSTATLDVNGSFTNVEFSKVRGDIGQCDPI